MKKVLAFVISVCLILTLSVVCIKIIPSAIAHGKEHHMNTPHSSHWHNNVSVSLSHPQSIGLDEVLNIEVTTTNTSGKNFCFGTSGTSLGKGVKILKIALNSDNSIQLYNRYAFETMDYREDCMRRCEVRKDCYAFELKVWTRVGEGEYDYGFVDAQKGAYDIFLSNGEIIRAAFEIV